MRRSSALLSPDALACIAAAVAIAACSIDGPSRGDSSSGHAATGESSASGGVSSSSGVGGSYVPHLPASFSVSGRVVDENGSPVTEAIVLQGGHSHEPTLLTGADGTFVLEMSYPGMGIPTAIATKQGFRTAGLEILDVPQGPIELQLVSVGPPDNESYAYGEPGKGKDPSTAFCGHCHDTIAAEFQTSKHARATSNPFVQDLYAGVNRMHATKASCEAAGGRWLTGRIPGAPSEAQAKCYVGGGVLSDLNPTCSMLAGVACDDPNLPAAQRPHAFGGCADCHSPGMNGPAGGRDLHDAVGVAFDNGVHCDFCHKVASVDPSLPAGTGGRLRVQRPSETFENAPPGGKLRPVMFGPLLDVPNGNMGGSLQPQFAHAEFCAGCHEHVQTALVPGTALASRFSDGLPVHTTYSEWLASPYAAGNTPCQHCHMPANLTLDSSADLGNAKTSSITFGFPRPADQIRQHIFRSPLVALSPQSLRLIDTALSISIAATTTGSALDVQVLTANGGCGHAVPTGDPMRAVLLLVEASCNGQPLAPNGGSTIDDVGGTRRRGVIGQDVAFAGSAVSWSAAAKVAAIGDVVRVVRPTGVFHDYDGFGIFAKGALPASEKGMPILAPVAQGTVIAVTAGGVTLDRTLPVTSGDIAYLGDATATLDGQPSRALAGASGVAFARVLLDGQGRRQAPHHRAVDVASDNRIAPARPQTTSHRFVLPPTCSQTNAEVRATLLYRPIPLAEAMPRGWTALDHRMGGSTLTVAVP